MNNIDVLKEFSMQQLCEREEKLHVLDNERVHLKQTLDQMLECKLQQPNLWTEQKERWVVRSIALLAQLEFQSIHEHQKIKNIKQGVGDG